MSFNINKDLFQDKEFQKLAMGLAQTVGAAINKIKQDAEIKESEKTNTNQFVDITSLVLQYQNLIGAKFKHRNKGTVYLLNEILNEKTDDNEKFPVMVSYYDIVKKTKWCRPLVEFHSNFTLTD